MPKANRTLKRVIDIALAIDLVAVMATAIVEEAPHEYLGISVFVLMIAHVVMNRRYFTHLAKGRYTPVRVIRLVAIVGVALCMLGQVISALVLSKHAFAFLPALPGASLARTAHMLFSYWGFVFAFAHAGLQVNAEIPRAGRIALIVVSLVGIASFAYLNIPAYLFGQVMFASADYAAPLALTFARYASAAVLVFTVFYYIRRLLKVKRSEA